MIYDRGLAALPSPRWSEYAHALIGCAFHDELVGTTMAPAPAGPGS